MLSNSTRLPATILVADAAPVFRRGLVQVLTPAFPDYCLLEAESGPELLALTATRAPALVLVAANLRDGPTGPASMLNELRRAKAQVPVVVLTDPASTPDPAMLRLLRQDVNGLLARNAPLEEVCETVRLVLQRGRCYSEYVLTLLHGQLNRRTKLHAEAVFSSRQLEVLRLIAEDLCNEEIADCLCTSVRTVEYHRSQMLHKAQARTTLGLVMFALRQGLLPDFAASAPAVGAGAG
jgi:DNA-binding NarL/FixJ family response regulator